MGEQAGGSSADEEARVAASSQPLRRSKRDPAVRRKPNSPRSTGAEGSTPVEASPAAPRRSQRHGAPASPAVTLVAPSASKATPTLAAARGPAIEPMALTAVPTPPSQSKRRPVNRPELRAPSGSSNTTHANSAVTVMGDASVTVRTQMRKVLGRYTARECSLVCESILEHLKCQSNLPTALDSEISPAHMDWQAIAALIETTHRMIISPRDCQDLWKFLAYAQTPDEAARADDELFASSDDEQYDWTVEEIQQRHLRAVKNTATPSQAPSTDYAAALEADDAAPEVLPLTADAPVEEATATQMIVPPESNEASVSTAPAGSIKDEQETPVISTEEAAASAAEATTSTAPVPSTVCLHPLYELPTGAPAGWEHPFQPKSMLPMTFVAEKFLKRKPYPTPVPQTPLAPAAASPAVAAGPSPAVPPVNPTQATVNPTPAPIPAPVPAPAPSPAPGSAPISLVKSATPAIETSEIASDEPALKKQKQEMVVLSPAEAVGSIQAPPTS